MDQPVIEIKNIGKCYKINHQRGGYVALRDVLTGIIKKPFSFLKAKVQSAVGMSKKEEFWALRDISLSVKRGEIIGIVGKNGAGKSTLLKILTGITPPTEGEIVMRGRVSSLLEVGTGFHPELTGRENIFLNGAILGMTRSEIAKKFDEIVEFAGIEQFLDTPVKHYSSGMYVRLAFSVAAHMDPDILLVDEVLAVGDAEFQKKCLGKMEQVTRENGRTILFVSHNMSAIEKLCPKTILLEKGRVKMFDDTKKIIDEYIQNYTSNIVKEWNGDAGDDKLRLTHTHAKSITPDGVFHTGAPIEIEISGEILKPVSNLIWGFGIYSGFDYKLAYTLYDDNEDTRPPDIKPGPFKKKFLIPANTLSAGFYRVEIDIGIHNIKRIVHEEGSLVFEVENFSGLGRRFRIGNSTTAGIFRPDWSQGSARSGK